VPLKIVALTGTAKPVGGAEKVLLSLVEGFRSRLGADVTVVSHVGDPGGTGSALALRRESEPSAVMVPRLRRVLQGVGRGAVLFPFQIRSNILAVLANASLPAAERLPVVANDRAHIDSLLEAAARSGVAGAIVLRALARVAYRRCDQIVCNSNENAEAVRQFVGPSGPGVVTIYNPVDAASIWERAEAARTSAPLRGRGVLVTAHGRIDIQQKGWDTLLHAYRRVLQEVPEARLRIVGGGHDLQRAEALARTELGPDVVQWPGHQPDPIGAIATGDVYVLPSRWEGFPNALLEAMAAGLPVVATRCPSGPAELLEDGRCGILVPVDDEVGLADALCKLLRNGDERGRLATLAQARARQFDIAGVVKQYSAIFDVVLERSSRRIAGA